MSVPSQPVLEKTRGGVFGNWTIFVLIFSPMLIAGQMLLVAAGGLLADAPSIMMPHNKAIGDLVLHIAPLLSPVTAACLASLPRHIARSIYRTGSFRTFCFLASKKTTSRLRVENIAARLPAEERGRNKKVHGRVVPVSASKDTTT